MAHEGWDYGLKGTSIQALHYLAPNLAPMQVLSLPVNHIRLLYNRSCQWVSWVTQGTLAIPETIFWLS